MTQSLTLIFEGVDRCGKTSLIDAFRKQWHYYQLEKMRVPRTLYEAVSWYEDYFRSICQSSGHKVWDRGHISEAVYAPLYKPYAHTSWPSTIWNYEEHFLSTQPVFIVYVYPVHMELLKADERPNASVQRELSAYDVALGETCLPVINITKHETSLVGWRDQEEVLRELIDKIDEQLSLFNARS